MYEDFNDAEKKIVALLSKEVGYDISNRENFGKITIHRKVQGVTINPKRVVSYIMGMLGEPASIVTTGDMIVMRAWDTIFVFGKNDEVGFALDVGPFSEHAFFTQGGEKYQVIPRCSETSTKEVTG